MSWQDILFGAGQWVLFAALIPSLVSQHKPALATSIVTGIVLSLFGLSFLTLELYFAGLSTMAVSAGWFLLAFQRYSKRNRR